MPSLVDVQEAFAAALLTGARGPVQRATMTLSPEQRIQIYRNHFTISLTECLAATFPVVRALVGETYFTQCARSFVAKYPPASPVLFEYGEAFPRFVADATRSDEFDYLADVGSFEWAINCAYHADDAMPIGPQELLSVPEDQQGALMLHLHPSVRLITSSYPVLAIWRANQPGAADETVDLRRGGERILIWRKGLDVGWRTLGAGETAFVVALLARASLVQACARAIDVTPDLKAGPLLAELFAGELVTGFSLPTDPNER